MNLFMLSHHVFVFFTVLYLQTTVWQWKYKIPDKHFHLITNSAISFIIKINLHRLLHCCYER